MAIRPTCPKCRKPAYRLYGQAPKPNAAGVNRSTSVPAPAVFCGEVKLTNGHGTFVKTKDHPHGLVVLDGSIFAAQVRQSRAMTSRLDASSRKGGRPSAALKAAQKGGKRAPKGKAAKPAKKAPKPTGAAAPKPRRGGKMERAADVIGSSE